MATRSNQLHTITVGGSPTAQQRLVMLHGIYGRGRNWQAIARDLTAVREDWGALLVDLRLHGESPAFEPPHTLIRAAEDILRLIAEVNAHSAEPPVCAVLGHSFGGKVALAVAASGSSRDTSSSDSSISGDGDSGGEAAGGEAGGSSSGSPESSATAGPVPPGPVRQVWVIDATPGTASEPRGSAWDMLGHVRSLPPAFAARAEASQGLQRLGWAPDVANWMATNLRYADGEFRWVLDFDALESMLRSYFATDLWPIVESPAADLDIHIVKAEQSSVLSDEACERITRAGARTGRVHLHRAAGGHWVHAENPRAIVDLLAQHLPSVATST